MDSWNTQGTVGDYNPGFFGISLFGATLASGNFLPTNNLPGYDFNGDGDLSFEEFFELFAAQLKNVQLVVSNIFYFHPENWGNDPI